MIVGVACVVPVITVGTEIALQPEAFVTSTVYEPAAIAVYVEFVAKLIAAAPLNHLYEVPALDVSNADPAGQTEVEEEVIVGVACVVPVITVATEIALQPLAFVTSTEYEPAAIAVYVEFVAELIAAAPLNHLYEAPVLDVSSADPAGQTEVEEGVMLAVHVAVVVSPYAIPRPTVLIYTRPYTFISPITN